MGVGPAAGRDVGPAAGRAAAGQPVPGSRLPFRGRRRRRGGGGAPRHSEVSATPPTSSAAAHQRAPLIPSPRNRAAADIPKTGTRSENGATEEAG
ncbi:hypothetical protein AWI43_17680 [Streptomyces sp. WAC04657]|nr:hypothetical protein AWI43_17680 [Streptomyces sp. WAC04657]